MYVLIYVNENYQKIFNGSASLSEGHLAVVRDDRLANGVIYEIVQGCRSLPCALLIDDFIRVWRDAMGSHVPT